MSRAEAIWIAGGDQSDYILQWTGTAVQETLQVRIEQGVPVGGTSAGLNVLTPFIYTAEGSQGVTSDKALKDPYNRLTNGRSLLTRFRSHEQLVWCDGRHVASDPVNGCRPRERATE